MTRKSTSDQQINLITLKLVNDSHDSYRQSYLLIVDLTLDLID
jgi:hypothetical protein